MTSEELERLEELEDMAGADELTKEDDPDTWEELKQLRSQRSVEKKEGAALRKWKKAKTALYVSLRDPYPDNDISFYVWDRAGLEAVACKQSWVDGLIDAVTVTEVATDSVGDVQFDAHSGCYYSAADMERWREVGQEMVKQQEQWELEHQEELEQQRRQNREEHERRVAKYQAESEARKAGRKA